VPESRAEAEPRHRRCRAPAARAGLTAVLLPLIEGRQHGWPLWTWVSLAAAPLISAASCAVSDGWASTAGALLDLRLFEERGFSPGIATQLFLASAQASFFVFLALYLQIGRGLGALEAGLVFTILAVAYVVTSGPAPGLTAASAARSSPRRRRADARSGRCSRRPVAEIGHGRLAAALVPGSLLVGAGIGLCFTR
jgi:hypothetical protein